MKHSVLAFAVGVILSLVAACTKEKEKDQREVFFEPVEPLEAAFRPDELGSPINFSALDDQDKALLNALYDGEVDQAKSAVQQGANPNLDCGHGCTALMLAAATGSKELVAMLKEAGAKPSEEGAFYFEILEFADRAKSPEFQKALKEIERIAGKRPVARGNRGDYRLELDAERAQAFLDSHHEELLDKGCFVFLYEEHFGIGNEPDVLLILPTTNKYAVMAYTGVNGANYGIENILVIRWMKRLEEQNPYLLTGCGFDFMSGPFKSKLPDAKAMAEAMYAFCPDIVEQGTGSVEALADELTRTNSLYFWWD